MDASAQPASFPPEGGGGRLSVATERDCSWSASAGANWITLSSNNGQGGGTIDFSVAANPDPSPRSTSFTINARQVELTQQPHVCRFQLSTTTVNLPSSGGRTAVSVTASSLACEWRARSDTGWIVLPDATSGKGTGQVTIEAAATSGPDRSGTVVIADQTVTVTQGSGCAQSIAPTSVNVGAAGGTGSVSVTSGAGCPWTAASEAPWITIASGASGSGNGSVNFSVEPTDGPPRSGTLLVAGHTFTVTQGTGCAFAIAPLGQSMPSAGGTGSLTVTTAGGCAWSANATAPWISITSGATGSGTGTVQFTVAANPGPQRLGTILAGGQNFTIDQASGCTFSIAPTEQVFDASGGNGAIAVTAGDGCAWNALVTVGPDWITITSGGNGAGSGSVTFTVAPNTGPPREGAINIQGQVFTIRQGA